MTACRQSSKVANGVFFPSPSEKVHRDLIAGFSNKKESPYMPVYVSVPYRKSGVGGYIFKNKPGVDINWVGN